MPFKPKSLLSILILLGGIATAWLLLVSKPKPEPQPHHAAPPHRVDVVSVKPESLAIQVSSQGTVSARTLTEVTAQISGEVTDVNPHFAAGGFFESGEVLLQLDPRDYEIAVIRAEASLVEAETQLAQEEGQARQAKREWRDLGSKAANDLFLRVPQLAAARANVKAAKAGLQKAKLDLERCEISLPFAGRVLEVKANLGQYINSGSVLGKVYAADVLEVRLPLTAAELQLLNLQEVNGLHELVPLDVTLGFKIGGDERRWQARIARLEASIDAKSRLFYLVAELEQQNTSSTEFSGFTLLPGAYVQAQIRSNPHANVVVLPRNALYQRNKVLVLDEESRLREQTVDVLQITETELFVRGLVTGQRVAISPPAYMDLGAVYTTTDTTRNRDA